MNDIEDEGKFKDAKGDDIVFQSFGIGDPGDVNVIMRYNFNTKLYQEIYNNYFIFRLL